MEGEEAEAKANILDPKWSGLLQRACKAPKGTKSRLSWMNHSLSHSHTFVCILNTTGSKDSKL